MSPKRPVRARPPLVRSAKATRTTPAGRSSSAPGPPAAKPGRAGDLRVVRKLRASGHRCFAGTWPACRSTRSSAISWRTAGARGSGCRQDGKGAHRRHRVSPATRLTRPRGHPPHRRAAMDERAPRPGRSDLQKGATELLRSWPVGARGEGLRRRCQSSSGLGDESQPGTASQETQINRWARRSFWGRGSRSMSGRRRRGAGRRPGRRRCRR